MVEPRDAPGGTCHLLVDFLGPVARRATSSQRAFSTSTRLVFAGFESFLATKNSKWAIVLKLTAAAIFTISITSTLSVNYGGSLIPLDRWFGTFHDGTPEGHQAMKARLRAMRLESKAV